MAMHCAAPGRVGTWSRYTSAASACDCEPASTPAPATSASTSASSSPYCSISSRCPMKPNPVTSVQATHPRPCRMPDAVWFDCTIDSIAALTQPPLAFPRISAASSVPVPSALVSSRTYSPARPAATSPGGTRGPLGRACEGSTVPVMAKPRAASAPSDVCPPTSAHPAERMATRAPASMCTSDSSTFSSGPYGSTHRASALTGLAFIAYTSDNAWLAAICPITYGSPMNDLK
mmetsp:Transcript_12978/g.28835  ORF Transcript_12978/g.28835 Transcript_12978/m.28835 type:complete len:233 (-) Transcript_12978:1349-2047(-)